VITALILIDHGSVREEANRMLEEVVALARARHIYDVVELAHMELATPTLAEAFTSCVDQGAEMILVHPYFLSPGRHSRSDIPRMAREAAASHPGVQAVVSEPLGIDERLVDVVLDRVRLASAHDAAVHADTSKASTK